MIQTTSVYSHRITCIDVHSAIACCTLPRQEKKGKSQKDRPPSDLLYPPPHCLGHRSEHPSLHASTPVCCSLLLIRWPALERRRKHLLSLGSDRLCFAATSWLLHAHSVVHAITTTHRIMIRSRIPNDCHDSAGFSFMALNCTLGFLPSHPNRMGVAVLQSCLSTRIVSRSASIAGVVF